MNVQKACDILHIDVAFVKDSEKLRKQYHKQALLHHPDKHPPDAGAAAAARFKEINAAYEYLTSVDIEHTYNVEMSSPLPDYCVLLEQFIISHYGESSMINRITKEVIYIYKEYTSAAHPDLMTTIAEHIRGLDDDLLNYVFDFICRYRHLLRIASGAIDALEKLLNSRATAATATTTTTADELATIYRLRPTLKDILESRLYRLTIKGAVYYVPLWERINYFDIVDDKRTLTVLCDPLLNAADDEENVWIDDGTLYIRESVTYEGLREAVCLGEGVLKIAGGMVNVSLDEIRITSAEQCLCVSGSGVPYGSIDNIQRGDVVAYLTLV